MWTVKALAVGVVLTVFWAVPHQLAAQSQPHNLDEPAFAERLAEQERRIRELEARLSRFERLPPVNATEEETAPARSTSSAESLASHRAPDGKDGSTAVGKWRDVSTGEPAPQIKGRVHSDFVMFAGQDAASTAAYGDLENYFEFRRIRLGVEGEAYNVYEYELEVDFEPENTFAVRNAANTGSLSIGTEAVSLKDAFVGVMDIPAIGTARFGHFKQPFSLEELTSASYITFMERGLPNAFSPGRAVGTAAFNHNDLETVTWGYGVFFNDFDDVTKQRVGDRQGVNVVGRLTCLPFYSPEGRYLVHLGIGHLFADVADDSIAFSSRPETHEEDNFLNTGALAAENYQVSNAEFAVVWGPLSLQGELFGAFTDGADAASNDQYWGAYAYLSYFLTGENRNYNTAEGKFGRVKPMTNFWIVNTCDGHCAGWGAWEAALRWSYLDLDDAGSTAGSRGQLNDVTVGLNWYWTPHTRWMMNYIHAFGDRADVGQNDTDILGTSLRFDF